MLLEGKNAVIHGAGGGSAASPGPSPAGARGSLVAGRTRNSLEAVTADITAAGGLAEVTELDAFDDRAVEEPVPVLAAG